MIKYIRKHYHWIIAITLFLMMGVRGGIANNLVSLHLIPVTGALNISRAQFALAGSSALNKQYMSKIPTKFMQKKETSYGIAVCKVNI